MSGGSSADGSRIRIGRKKKDEKNRGETGEQNVSNISSSPDQGEQSRFGGKGPRSYKFLSPMDTVCAAVNILRISPNAIKYKDHNYNFTTRLDLVRDEDVTYRICIFPESNPNNHNVSTTGPKYQRLDNLLSVEEKPLNKRQNCIYAVFEHNFWVHVEFKHLRHFEYFSKMMKEVLKINEVSKKSKSDPSQKKKNREFKVSRKMVSYVPPRRTVVSKVFALSAAITAGGFSKTGEKQFYEIQAEIWTPIHIYYWVTHTFVQINPPLQTTEEEKEKSKPKVITLYEYMENEFDKPLSEEEEEEEEVILSKQEQKKKKGKKKKKKKEERTKKQKKSSPPLQESLFQQLVNYFTLGKNSTYLTLLKEIRISREDPAKVHNMLKSVLEDTLIRDTLEREINSLKRNRGLFDIKFFLVLKKRVSMGKNEIESGDCTLESMIYDLRTTNRYWWSVLDCRDLILSLLLYRKDFEAFIQEKEEEFFRLEEKVFGEKIGDLEWTNDGRHVLIDPDEWEEQVLKKFNQDVVRFSFEKVSFRIHIANQQNELRKELKKMRQISEFKKKEASSESSKLEELQNELNELNEEIKIKKNRNEIMFDRVFDLQISAETEDEKKRLLKMEAQQTEMDKQLISLSVKKKGLETKINHEKLIAKDEASDSRKDPKMVDLEKKIRDHVSGMLRRKKKPFMAREKRRTIIRTHLLDQLDELSGIGNNMCEFPVKLVISILRDHVPKEWQRKFLQKLDRFFTPKFFKWGFIHASAQISSLGCHWFSSSLVVLTDLSVGRNYEELIAIDCCCPLIVNSHTVLERLNRLSEDIVFSNVNHQYEQANIVANVAGLGSVRGEYINCQEFANQLIVTLERTEFFPVVQNYISELRNLLMKKANEKHNSKNLRFIKVNYNNKFYSTYKSVWNNDDDENNNLFKPDGKGRVYFNSHKEVDGFYNACIEVVGGESMNLLFPGEFQLLKGFDRAFWMIENDYEKNKECPFLSVHKSECHNYPEKRGGGEVNQVVVEEEEVEGEGNDE